MELNATQQLLVATAWIDGRMDPAEARLIEQILSRSGLPAEAISAALKGPAGELGPLLEKIPQGQPRHQVMREVLQMCFADDVLEFEEFDLIDRVARQLGLGEDELEALRQEVTAQP